MEKNTSSNSDLLFDSLGTRHAGCMRSEGRRSLPNLRRYSSFALDLGVPKSHGDSDKSQGDGDKFLQKRGTGNLQLSLYLNSLCTATAEALQSGKAMHR